MAYFDDVEENTFLRMNACVIKWFLNRILLYTHGDDRGSIPEVETQHFELSYLQT